MKKSIIILSILVILSLFASCASSDIANNPDEWNNITRTITITGKTQAELYDSVNEWLVGGFVSAKDVIQYQNAEMGKIVGKYTYPATKPTKTVARQVMHITALNEKVIIKFYNPERAIPKLGKQENWEPTIYISAFEEAHKDWNLIMDDLEAHLKGVK